LTTQGGGATTPRRRAAWYCVGRSGRSRGRTC
jgi:hypothetical protein